MKILVDTNVLISAMVFDGRIYRLLDYLFRFRDHNIYLLVSEYIDKEFKNTLNRKWPRLSENMYRQYRTMSFIFCESTSELTGELRDCKDIPVLSDALYHNADIILTGDKDFLEAGITHPLIYSPSMLADLLRIP
ncbi:MAG: putative toxin-antitoxin system toxin component, PIN family [Synergistaceae bacterium]|nr:putative toxin-antitoxin system toxin component, PIN family [Synergistaceae bacterium]